MRVALVSVSASPRATVEPLRRWHLQNFEFRSSVERHIVMEGLHKLLDAQHWAWAGLIDRRVALIGGFVWCNAQWCYTAVAAAHWLRPMQWRPFLPVIRAKLEAAHDAGALRIETNIDGRWAPAHRLAMSMGFVFQGMAMAHDHTTTPWVTYARFHRDAPAPPLAVTVAMCEAHVRILETLVVEEPHG